MLKKILFFEFVIPEQKAILEANRPEGYEVVFWELLNHEEKASALKEAEYFFIVAHQVTEDLIRSAPKLRHIQRSGVGVNNVDVAAADACGVTVSILPIGNATAVAEHAILLPLALYRRLIEVDRDTKAGEWPMWKYRINSYEMDGKVHGFVGLGNIGRLTAMRSKGFGTTIIYYDMFRLSEERETELGVTYLSMEEVIKQADILSLHVPLTEENRGLIGRKEIEMMKPGALLINVSRGGLVDETALYDALVSGKLGGAGLDTWQDEPNIKGNPLLTLDNVIATAHVAAGTIDTFHKQVAGAFRNILKADRAKKPDFVVGAVKEIK